MERVKFTTSDIIKKNGSCYCTRVGLYVYTRLLSANPFNTNFAYTFSESLCELLNLSNHQGIPVIGSRLFLGGMLIKHKNALKIKQTQEFINNSKKVYTFGLKGLH